MGTATEHDAEPVAAAPASPGDDCGTDDDLYPIIHNLINECVWRPTGPRVAAIAILEQPAIRDALHARDVVAQLDREHQPRRWSDQSDVVVCDCCQRSWPCSVRATLDGAVT